MNRMTTATEVAQELAATEAAVETALAQAVRLLRRMMDARRELGLPVGVGEPAMRSVTAAVSALGEAQQDVVRTHGVLHALQRDLGLPTTDFGALAKPGEDAGAPVRRAG